MRTKRYTERNLEWRTGSIRGAWKLTNHRGFGSTGALLDIGRQWVSATNDCPNPEITP